MDGGDGVKAIFGKYPADRIQALMAWHGIDTERHRGRVLALDVVGGRRFAEYVDVTDWNERELYRWLGY